MDALTEPELYRCKSLSCMLQWVQDISEVCFYVLKHLSPAFQTYLVYNTLFWGLVLIWFLGVKHGAKLELFIAGSAEVYNHFFSTSWAEGQNMLLKGAFFFIWYGLLSQDSCKEEKGGKILLLLRLLAVHCNSLYLIIRGILGLIKVPEA